MKMKADCILARHSCNLSSDLAWSLPFFGRLSCVRPIKLELKMYHHNPDLSNGSCDSVGCDLVIYELVIIGYLLSAIVRS
jgi:hypothetical protein